MYPIIDFAHILLKNNISKQDIALDLTIGGGCDTLFLVRHARFVYGFDIQKKALAIAKEKLIGYDNFELINDSHEHFSNYVRESFKAAILNLGYLPGGDKTITTKANITLSTIKKILRAIEFLGICVVVVYPGHKEGSRESDELLQYLETLDQHDFAVLNYRYINQINYPPYLLAIRRLR